MSDVVPMPGRTDPVDESSEESFPASDAPSWTPITGSATEGVRPRYRSFADFYPHYLEEHQHPVSRRLHVAGTGAMLLVAGAAIATRRWKLLAAAPVIGYGCAWIGHFVFERNRPTTFSQPFYSLLGDFRMVRDVLTRRIPF